jgi:uncharacterized spore protein YtfJ
MKLDEFVTSARDMLSVRRVYAEPFEKDGVTVIPAASVAGGGGGGEGHDEKGGHGQGGGFGLGARPVGAYVVKAGEVRWVPAVDVNHVVTAVSAVAVAYLFTRARVARVQAKAIAAGSR